MNVSMDDHTVYLTTPAGDLALDPRGAYSVAQLIEWTLESPAVREAPGAALPPGIVLHRDATNVIITVAPDDADDLCTVTLSAQEADRLRHHLSLCAVQCEPLACQSSDDSLG